MTNWGGIGSGFCVRWGGKTPQRAARKALETMIPTSSKSPIPVDLEAAARYVGIEQIVESETEKFDGLLSLTPSGKYIANLRKGQGHNRRRFTLAHEVGHAIVFASLGRHSPSEKDVRLTCSAETADNKDE